MTDKHEGPKVISPARNVSYQVLCRIELDNEFSDDALHAQLVDELEPRDRDLTTRIVYGTLRWQGLLDHVLAESVTRPWEDVDPPCRILLRMSLYQMWRTERIPDYALVNDAVELAKRRLKRGIEGFVNGVLRNLARKRPWEQASLMEGVPSWVRVSLPRWLWERWSGRFGENSARAFALSLNEPPRTALRMPPTTWLPHGLIPSDIVPGAFIVPESGLPEEYRGSLALHAQDEASQLVPRLFGNIEGCSLWDACSAPGGKSAILCDMVESGIVVASDLHAKRLDRMRTLGRPAHLLLCCADARGPIPFRTEFDAVLADVPCSGLGTIRRNPEIRWRITPDILPRLHDSQIAILNSVARAVRRGGSLLYSTCSTEPEENEQVVDEFLAASPEFQLVRPSAPSEIDHLMDERGIVRTFPGTRVWDGFFAALMTRK